MLRNYFRQSFWVVFFPLLIAAGIFWMGELRGYRAEMTLLVLPKAETAKGAAGNLAAIARAPSFAMAIYAADDRLDTPFDGKLAGERKGIWRTIATIEPVTGSDLVAITTRAADPEEATLLARGITEGIVRTASGLYNQKTDLDIRIIEEATVNSALSAWPRFTFSTVLTAFTFTVIFFLVYSFIEAVFPRRSNKAEKASEYVISPETFKPRVPTYWAREENGFAAENVAQAETETLEPAFSEVQETETEVLAPVTSSEEAYAEVLEASEPLQSEDMGDARAEEIAAEPVVMEQSETESPFLVEDSSEEIIKESEALTEKVEEMPSTEADESLEADPAVDEDIPMPDEAPAHLAEQEDVASDDADDTFYQAAAPDNLPVIEADAITPLQGAQARLMKYDIDAAASALASEPVPMEIASAPEAPSTPQIHEPSPEDYKRRLNELLSGKM